MEWKPIETAPKDGTRVLLFFDKHNCRGMRESEVVLGFWHQPGNPLHKRFWTGWGASRVTATHWMPLPEAPNDPNSGAARGPIAGGPLE
jgi:hypothetical protein